MNTTKVEDRLADFTRDKRLILLSLMAIAIGTLSALVAEVLVWLIAVITNPAFYQRFSSVFQSPEGNHLGYPGRAGVMGARLKSYDEEHVREAGLPTRSAKV